MEQYEKSLGHWIKRFYLLSVREMELALSPYGLGRTQWYILFHVDDAGTLLQRELQSVLNVESATLTPLVSALVKKAWLRQQPSSKDRRSKILSLTTEGSEHFHSIPNPILRARQKALAGINAKAIEDALKVLQQAVRNMEE